MQLLSKSDMSVSKTYRDLNKIRPERTLNFLEKFNIVPSTKSLKADCVSFTSLTKPNLREKQEAINIEKLLNKHLLEPIKEKVKDISTFIRLKAFEAIKILDPLQYTTREKALLKKAQDMALDTISKYDDGKDIQSFIKELKKQGFKFYLANDKLPEDLWTDEAFLESWGMEDYDIDDQLENPVPLRVNDVLTKNGSAEIHYERDDCKAMFLFNEKPPRPDVFWHEYFHYCQKVVGLMDYKGNIKESMNSKFAKRELETYEFVVDLRNKLKTKSKDIRLDIAIWNSYKDLYHFNQKQNEKVTSKVLENLSGYDPNSKFDLNLFTITLDLDVKEIKRERQQLKEIISLFGVNPEEVES